VSRARNEDEPEAPAIITPEFQQDRVLSKDAGSKSGWRRLTPLQKAFELRQITQEHYDAALIYENLWDLSVATGRNCLDDSGGGGYSGGMSLSQVMLDATRKLALIEVHMPKNDRKIVQCFVGQAWKMAETIRFVTGGYTKSTTERVREALDSLIAAMETARRSPPIRAVS